MEKQQIKKIISEIDIYEFIFTKFDDFASDRNRINDGREIINPSRVMSTNLIYAILRRRQVRRDISEFSSRLVRNIVII